MADLSLYSIKATLILDNEGNRLYTKYYSPPHADTEASSTSLTSSKDQKAFEKSLFAKTNKQNSDVLIFDNHLIVYKQILDVSIYLVASSVTENEAMLFQVLIGIKDALSIVLANTGSSSSNSMGGSSNSSSGGAGSGGIDKRAVLEHYDLVSLVIDEAIDSGIILEVDPTILANRTSKMPKSGSALDGGVPTIELSEQGLHNVFQFARGKLTEKLRQFQ
ncbi:hypothetical protein D0Z03_000743 [Geotrichum reessii]|nr:hypothetical protein D0Z03_000743 [Galactomyces reessii]